jgi:predicted outer membrane repeat protein
MLGGPVEISGGSSVSNNGFAATGGTFANSGDGGGIFANLGSIRIDGGIVRNNVATHDGGGIWSGGSLSVANSDISENTALGNSASPNLPLGKGGGIFNRGTFTSSGSTIVNNRPDNVFP